MAMEQKEISTLDLLLSIGFILFLLGVMLWS